MKVFVSLHEYFDKTQGATVSVVIFNLKPDYRGRYSIDSSCNSEIKGELEKYSYFSMYPEIVEDYHELNKNPQKQKLAAKIGSYIPQHIKRMIERLDGKRNFVYYQQFHLNAL